MEPAKKRKKTIKEITETAVRIKRLKIAQKEKEQEKRDSAEEHRLSLKAKKYARPKVISLLARDRVEEAVDLAFENSIWKEIPLRYLKQYAEEILARDFDNRGSIDQYLGVSEIYKYKELADRKLASEAKAKANRIYEFEDANACMEIWLRS